MPFVQPAVGAGIGITDYRGSCAMNAQNRYDFGLRDDGALRKFAQENATKVRDNTLQYVPSIVYFGTGCQFVNQNPPPGANPYYQK